MIVDSSALMAILETEDGADRLAELAVRSACRMSTATYVEVGVVADARSARHGARLDDLIAALEIELVPVSTAHARLARQAYRRYGRGSGSPARLNFGDCFAYALATATGEPLLFIGDDFHHTDVLVAARPPG